MPRTDIRFALPSKGRLEIDSLGFLAECGLRVYKPNPRQYQATTQIPRPVRVATQYPTPTGRFLADSHFPPFKLIDAEGNLLN